MDKFTDMLTVFVRMQGTHPALARLLDAARGVARGLTVEELWRDADAAWELLRTAVRVRGEAALAGESGTFAETTEAIVEMLIILRAITDEFVRRGDRQAAFSVFTAAANAATYGACGPTRPLFEEYYPATH